ncbi:hypothetical protein EBB07_25035 [Paenibacillaceae bacterium]|nr:hypothetical protein EBB07_25035 [Paenibacillaceae bacterium]
MQEIRLAVDYDEYEEGKRIEQLIEELAGKPESSQISVLTIGDWGQAYENGPEDLITSLISHKDSFPSLQELYIGDMSSEECEVSWITQTNIAPILAAFPDLRSLTIQGSNELRLDPLKHAKLETLVIVCGGLPKAVLSDIVNAELPELRKLELYLGVDNYGFDGTLDDVLPLMETGRFPKLKYLGLKDSEIQDEIAIAIANAPIVEQLDTLDLSQGTLSDTGAEALLQSDAIKRLSHLDLSYHYMSPEMMKRWQASGMSVDISDEQHAEDDDWRYPSLTE